MVSNGRQIKKIYQISILYYYALDRLITVSLCEPKIPPFQTNRSECRMQYFATREDDTKGQS
jgi:hypothetical protein